MNSLGVPIIVSSFCYAAPNVSWGKLFLVNPLLHLKFCTLLLLFLIFQFLCRRPCGLFFLSLFSLFPDNPHQISPKVITRATLVFTPSGTIIHVSPSKTIQCNQRTIVLPIPSIPRSRICPISALHCHLSVNPGASLAPLFSVLLGSRLEPITCKHFSGFFSRVASRLQLDPLRFSPHSFRHSGATFAFDRHVPPKIIKLQGDLQSDAYLVYLELSQQQKQHA